MFPNFDPSKLDPKTLMELSQLVRELPPEQLNRLQSLMHNMGAGFDVRRELEEFERSLPPGFRERMAALMLKAQSSQAQGESGATIQPMNTAAGGPEDHAHDPPGSLHDARMTVLRAVADGRMAPEEAEKILFPEG